LRRVDWRFLTFGPWPAKSVVFGDADGTLKDAVKLISESTAAPGSPPDESCDLAVAENPDPQTLERIYAFLRPGGASYIEWTIGPSFKADSLIRKIKAAGLGDPGLYLLKPDFTQSHPVMWIPLKSPGAIEYTLLGNYIEEELAGAVRKYGAHLRVLLYKLFPCAFINLPGIIVPNKKLTVCTIASKPETRAGAKASARKEESPSLEESRAASNLSNVIESTLNRRGHNIHSDGTNMHMITRGNTQNKKIGLLIFPGQSSEPAFIVKIPRVEESLRSLKNEGSVLGALGKEIKWIPEVLFNYDEPGFYALGQTLVNGMRITGRLDNRTFEKLARNITVWLIELARKTKTPSGKDDIRNKIEKVTTAFTDCYGTVMTEEEMLRIRRSLESLDLDYTVCEHRDLGPWNILTDSSDTPGIIDWENSSLRGFPFSDLMTFFTWTSIYLENANVPSKYKATYRGLLDASTFTGGIFNECVARYCTELGIPPDSIPALRLLNLLIQAQQELSQIKNRIEDPLDEANSIEHGCHIQLLREDMLVHAKT